MTITEIILSGVEISFRETHLHGNVKYGTHSAIFIEVTLSKNDYNLRQLYPIIEWRDHKQRLLTSLFSQFNGIEEENIL